MLPCSFHPVSAQRFACTTDPDEHPVTPKVRYLSDLQGIAVGKVREQPEGTETEAVTAESGPDDELPQRSKSRLTLTITPKRVEETTSNSA